MNNIQTKLLASDARVDAFELGVLDLGWAPVQAKCRPEIASDDAGKPAAEHTAGVTVGTVAMVGDDGILSVEFPANPTGGAVRARSCVNIGRVPLGATVVLAFEAADPLRPIILGVVSIPPSEDVSIAGATPPQQASCELDGERLVFNAKREIIFRCGKASIQLLADGSVRIRGTELLNRASGTNRIRGGNVQIN